MQTSGRLIENIERLASRAPAQLGSKFDTLRLTTAKGRGGLAELNIAKAHLVDRCQLASNCRNISKELTGLLDRHIQDVANRLTFVGDLKRLTIIAFTMTLGALNIDIGQEVHLYLNNAIALAVLAAPTLNVEAKAPWLVAADIRLRRARKKLANLRKDTGIGSRVGARGATNCRLVDDNCFIELFDPINCIMCTWHCLGAV